VAQLASGAQLVFAAGVEIDYGHVWGAIDKRPRHYSKGLQRVRFVAVSLML
jgi:hypothetical protein